MSTENSSPKGLDLAFLGLGLLFLGFFHLFALKEVPGLHFDEAWAANYAWRIASEPGFWPLHAQSPYTAPWAHYWAALWMKLFGPSVLVFRLSQVALSLTGLGFLSLALRARGFERAALLVPLTAALLPGLVLNHRFAIELNGFHALCFGLLFWARTPWVKALAWLVGSTAHVLFFGVGLALLGAVIWEKRELTRAERRAGFGASLLLALFFVRVAFLIPEKGKGLALVLVGLLAAISFLLPFERRSFGRRWADSLVGVLSSVFLANALFFLQGSWSVAISTGEKTWTGAGMIGVVLFVPLALWLLWRGSREAPRFFRRWFLLSVIVLGAMMLKPAPRYFEVVFLAAAAWIAVGLASMRALPRFSVLLFFALHAAWLYPNYFLTVPKEESLRLLFWKDSSRDFLSKQRLADVLGGSGCSLSDIKSVDSRVREALIALSRRDWPLAEGECKWKELHVGRRAETEKAPNREEVADFVLWGTR